jgi:hypothetical protein
MTSKPLQTRLRRPVAVALCLAIALASSGCVRVLAIGAKVFHGDPRIISTLERKTQVELQAGEHAVALVVEAPHHVDDAYPELVHEVQTELHRLMRRHGIHVLDMAAVDGAIENCNGVFEPTRLARDLDVDYIIHAEISAFTDVESSQSNLLYCRAQGQVQAYEVRGATADADRLAVARMEESFHTSYPQGHPLPADQTPRREFQRTCARQVAASIGRHTYDVLTSELY